MVDKIIWQPRLYHEGYEFEIYLDREFAREMITSPLSPEKAKRMNELANDKLKSLGINWHGPYQFHEDTCFLTSAHLGRGGTWLSTNHQTIDALLKEDNEEETVKYGSHNVDIPKEVHALMTLFNQWIHYSDILKKQD